MSLFSSVQMAGNALMANQIALQVTGQNISNANTPGYFREEVQLTPGPTQQVGSVLLGTGVEVSGVTQQVNTFLEGQLQGAISDQSNTSTQQQAYIQLEQTVGALDDNSLSTSMTTFFNSISQVLNDPSDLSSRNMVVLNGESLAQQIQQLAQQATSQRNDLNTQVSQMGGQINQLLQQISGLNTQIAQIQAGNTSSTAVGLTDQQNTALQNLAQLINIKVENQPNGSVNVYCGGDCLVTAGTSTSVAVTQSNVNGLPTAQISIQATGSPLEVSSGELYGLTNARDNILGGFLSQLNQFASTFALEFNKVYSAGQGLDGFSPTATQPLTSEFSVTSADAPLNKAGLQSVPSDGSEPTDGSFTVTIYQNTNGTEVPVQSGVVTVQLNGTPQDTTLNSLAAQLNSISGLSASVTADGKLALSTTAANEEITFGGDTSGVLAALGLNTFFTGSSAEDLGVSTDLQADPGLFSASQGGLGADTNNASALAGFMTQPLSTQNGASVSDLYNQIVSNVSQGSANAQTNAAGAETYQQTLQGQETSISGVNIDEETVNMLQYQQSYQAVAKYISVLETLLQTLTQL
ncbi:MAG: flagellar hook-associated protein FlgK [Thermoguttaceae bacterium]